MIFYEVIPLKYPKFQGFFLPKNFYTMKPKLFWQVLFLLFFPFFRLVPVSGSCVPVDSLPDETTVLQTNITDAGRAFVAATATEGLLKIRNDSLNVQLGQEFSLDLKIENLSVDYKILAIQFELLYDTSKVHWLDSLLVGDLTSTAICELEETAPGKLEVAMIYDQYITGSGNLLSLQFYAKELGNWIPEFGYFLLNTDSINDIQMYPLQIYSFYGDVDDNGSIQAYDAGLVLHYSVGLDPLSSDPTPWEDWRVVAADVNADSILSSYDAALILQKSIHKIDSFPVDGMLNLKNKIKSNHLYIPGFSGDSADTTGDVEYYSDKFPDIKVTVDASFLVFYSVGDLIALNVDIPLTNMDLGSVIYSHNVMKAENKTSDCFKLGLALTEPLINGAEILRVPFFSEGNSLEQSAEIQNDKSSPNLIELELKVNEFRKTLSVDLNTSLLDPKGSDFYFDRNSKQLYLFNPDIQFCLLRDLSGKARLKSSRKQIDFSNLQNSIYMLTFQYKNQKSRSFKLLI